MAGGGPQTRDLIAIGASAGGVEALGPLVGGLPADFPASLVVVMHVSPAAPSRLASLLARAGPLPAQTADHGESIEPGRIYVAPHDHHLLVHGGQLLLNHGPREHHSRPAIDPLFRSAARARGAAAVGVVLTGALGDGAAGLRAITAAGGVAVVQDPEGALYPDMPRHAIAGGPVDHVVPLEAMPELLDRLVREPVEEREAAPAGSSGLDSAAARRNGGDPALVPPEHQQAVAETFIAQEAGLRTGVPALYTCPDCGGVLWEFEDGNVLSYRCHVGHAFSADALMLEREDNIEEAMWSAVRALEEQSSLARRVATRLGPGVEGARWPSTRRLLDRAEHASRQASALRRLLAGYGTRESRRAAGAPEATAGDGE